MADDPIENLAVGVAADHQADKRRRKAKGDDVQPETVEGNGDGAPLPPIEGDGASELREAVADLGGAVEEREADADRVADLAADRLVRMVQEARFERGTLVGDVRDAILDTIKANPKPWSAWTEDQQRTIASAVETVARTIVQGAVLVIAEDDAPAIHAKLESYAEKGGLKIALTATGDRDTVLALHDAVGQNVVVRRADATRYQGERRDPGVKPDQGDLGFEADADDLNPFDEGDGGDKKPDDPDADDDLAGVVQDQDQ